MYRILFNESEVDPAEPVHSEISTLSQAYMTALSFAQMEIEDPRQFVSVESYMEELDDIPAAGDGILIMEMYKVQGHIVTTIEFAQTDVL